MGRRILDCRSSSRCSSGGPCRSRGLTGISASSGFTLIEIAIVIFIMGLMMTIAIPYFGGITQARLKSQARQLAGRITYLYDEASAQKVVLRLTFDLDTNSYHVSRLDPFQLQAMFVPVNDPLMGNVMLPAGVRIHDVTVGQLGTFTRGTVSCNFYPTGWADSGLIHMMDSHGDTFTLAIDSLTGQVAIAHGKLSQSQMMAAAQ
ncbi:MAG: pilus assembly FimT family protein [Candidatus Binataceae bacterium]